MSEVSHSSGEVSHTKSEVSLRGPHPKYKVGQVFKWAKWVVIIQDVRNVTAKLHFSDGYIQWFFFDTMDEKLEEITIKDKLELL